MSPDAEIDRLFAHWLGGSLSEGDGQRLMELLKDAGHRRRLRALADLEGALAELGTAIAAEPDSAAPSSRPPLAGPAPGRSSRPLRRYLAFAALLTVLVGAAQLWHGRSSGRGSDADTAARITAVRGIASVIHERGIDAAAVGAEVRSCDALSLGVAGQVSAQYRDGTLLVLEREGAELRFERSDGDKRLALRDGGLRARVAKQPAGRPLSITTRHARAEVVGTAFSLEVGADSTVLETSEGVVRLTGLMTGESVDVAAGERAVAGMSGSPVLLPAVDAALATSAPDRHASWPNGISADRDSFPIGVWLQAPADAAAYKQAGINLYVHLWQGPSEADLSTLAAVGMKTICAQNDVALRHLDDPTIVGWMHECDPDDARPDGRGGNVPPMTGSQVIDRYRSLELRDPSRPVLLIFDEGVAWDDFPGRGVRSGHPEDYLEYIAGGDILAFHIYPMNHRDPAVSGNLWYLPLGVDRLRAWSGRAKPVWCWIECTSQSAERPAPSADQVRSEVWMALIHGATGIVYFCHSFSADSQDDAALLHDPAMLAAVTAINRQVTSLAPILNSPDVATPVAVSSSNNGVPIEVMAKRYLGSTYVFAAAMRDGATTATFTVPDGARVEVLGEERAIATDHGIFSDGFTPYAVHLYKITE